MRARTPFPPTLSPSTVRRTSESGGASTPILIVAVLVVGVVVAVVAAVAGRPVAPPASSAAIDVEDDLRRLRDENRSLTRSLEGVSMRLEALELDLARLHATPAPDRDREPEPTPAAAESPIVASLAGEPAAAAGEEALEKQVEAALERRELARSARALGIDLDAFAEEAGLTDEQSEALATLLGTWREKVRVALGNRMGRRPETPEERQAMREQMTATLGTVREEILTEAREILEPAQFTSLEQQMTTPTPGGPGGGFGLGGGRGRR